MKKEGKIDRALALADEHFLAAVAAVAIVTYALGSFSFREIRKRMK